MLYKTYGRTGKKVSVVAFGGMRFPEPAKTDEMAEIVLHAYNKGVTYFDTAPFYCDDKSEDIMGAAIKQMKPGTFYVSTKCGADDGAEMRRSLENSLKRLGLDRVDFFHIWCLIRPEQWAERKAKGAVGAALKAKEEGLVNHVVFSSHMYGRQIREIIREGVCEGVTLGYNAINFPFRQEAVDAAGEAGLGVVTMNPLGGGVIAANAKRFDFIRGPQDPDVVSAALRFNISQPAITAALVGFSSKQHVDQAVAAVENFQPYDQAHIEKMKKHIESGFEGLCTGCGYCLPCPQNIEIPKMMDAYNQKILGGEPPADRLRWHWGLSADAAAECVQCGACEGLCTQRLPIMERMQFLASLKG